MPRDPELVYIPASLLDDRRLSARDRDSLMRLIALAHNSAQCDYDERALAQKLGVTTRTLRKRLARLESFGYIVHHKLWVEMHADLVLTDDCLLIADLPPLSDEEFARLQLADDPDLLLKEHAKQFAGKRLFFDLPRALIEGRPRPERS
jgi:hypothetical protein